MPDSLFFPLAVRMRWPELEFTVQKHEFSAFLYIEDDRDLVCLFGSQDVGESVSAALLRRAPKQAQGGRSHEPNQKFVAAWTRPTIA